MSSSRALDAAVAFPLLVVHVIVAVGGAGAVMLSGSGLDPCSYRPCGDPRWADLALDTVLVTAVALPVIDLLLIVVQLVRGGPPGPSRWCCASCRWSSPWCASCSSRSRDRCDTRGHELGRGRSVNLGRS